LSDCDAEQPWPSAGLEIRYKTLRWVLGSDRLSRSGCAPALIK
jgi:hypothetical protein